MPPSASNTSAPTAFAGATRMNSADVADAERLGPGWSRTKSMIAATSRAADSSTA